MRVDGGPDPPVRQELTGGFMSAAVTRFGDVVRRSAGDWSPAVHAWLGHLAAAGADLAPHPRGFDPAAGVETLSFIDGTVLSGGA